MKTDLNRREFVAGLASLPFAARAAQAQQGAPIPIVDSHIHLFDKTRPEGAPWPVSASTPAGASALPSRYIAVAKPFGIVGTIVVEANARIEDNQWVLDHAAANPIIVGTVGRIETEQPEFAKHLERFRKNNLFLGIRQYGFSKSLERPEFIPNLKLLADAGLSIDTILQTGESIAAVRVTDAVPSLRVILDHLPNMRLPEDRARREADIAGLRELGKRPQVYVKLSEVIKRVDGKVSTDLSVYREWLDQIWDIFGENRILFGSDWPNSENVEPNSFPDIMTVARAYVAAKGPSAVEKIFWKNSIPAYHWVKRDATQPRI